MSAILRAYDSALNRSPILTKTLTSIVLFAAGDTMSQRLEGGPFDFGRLLRMSAWGGIFSPLAHYWYLGLDRYIPGKGAAVVAKKVAADQLTWTLFINATFFFYSTFAATGDAAASIHAIRDKMWPTLKVNWSVWPILTGINVSVVPLQYRILFVNFCSLFWSAFLSNMANSTAPVPDTANPTELK